MTGDKDKLLNERNELITKCRHVDKFLLKNYKSRRRGRGRGKDRGQWCSSIGFFVCSCVFLKTSYFRLVLLVTVWGFERRNSE